MTETMMKRLKVHNFLLAHHNNYRSDPTNNSVK